MKIYSVDTGEHSAAFEWIKNCDGVKLFKYTGNFERIALFYILDEEIETFIKLSFEPGTFKEHKT